MNVKLITKVTLVAFLVVFGGMSFVSAADPVEGLWKTVADEGENKGKATSYVKIYQEKGVFKAQITKLLIDPADSKCDKCKGWRKDKPVVGMVIVWGMKKDGDKEYEGGKILDPGNGKTYGCKMELLSKTKLKVRGFIGFSLLGRNQYWWRVK